MINRELIEVFSEIAREKNIDRTELGSIIEQLFLYIIEKQNGDSSNCSVIVNLDKGEIEIYAEKTIVDKVKEPHLEITLKDVLKKDPDLSDLQVGDPYIEVIDQYYPSGYRMEVTSVGITANLGQPFQFRKNIGRQLKLKLIIDNSFKSVKATLKDVDEEGIYIQLKEEINHINYADIKKAKIIVSFS